MFSALFENSLEFSFHAFFFYVKVKNQTQYVKQIKKRKKDNREISLMQAYMYV